MRALKSTEIISCDVCQKKLSYSDIGRSLREDKDRCFRHYNVDLPLVDERLRSKTRRRKDQLDIYQKTIASLKSELQEVKMNHAQVSDLNLVLQSRVQNMTDESVAYKSYNKMLVNFIKAMNVLSFKSNELWLDYMGEQGYSTTLTGDGWYKRPSPRI